MQILNNLGDYNLVDRLIRSCGENKVPLPKPITSTLIIDAAVGNFDHIENSQPDKDSNRDTVVIHFISEFLTLHTNISNQ